MSITNMEIKFSKYGITTADQPRKELYGIIAVLQHDNQKKKQRIYLENFIRDKKSLKRAFAGETFIAVQVDEQFYVHDMKGILQGAVSTAEHGNLVQVNENSFILCKDKTITWISDKSEVLNSRELTEMEYKSLFG